jgi:hypothetical protein
MFRVVKSVYYTFICVHGMYGIYTLYMYVNTVYMCKQFLIIIHGLNNPRNVINTGRRVVPKRIR